MFGLIAVAAPATAATEDGHHWYFESLSSDGKRALLRELDPAARATFHFRSVDVESGGTLADVDLPELARIPRATIGDAPTELAALEWMLTAGGLSRDIVRGAQTIRAFPFGECGRLAAAPSASAIAFDAGDWLYVADEHGRVQRRVVEEAAYDPRFTPDGKHILFRRASGSEGVLAKYELFVVPADLSAPPRALAGTEGVRDRFVADPTSQTALAVASQNRGKPGAPETCVLSLSLRPPFAVKRLACVDGSEQLVESVISPKGKWAALSTKKRDPGGLTFRLRVVSLASGKIVVDEPDAPGLVIRAISDRGLLVQSGVLGAVVQDVTTGSRRELDPSLFGGSSLRAVFRSDKELVYVAGGTVRLLDVTTD